MPSAGSSTNVHIFFRINLNPLCRHLILNNIPIDRFFVGLLKHDRRKPTIYYGATKLSPGGRGELSVPVKRILHACRRFYRVILVNEHLTTKTHSRCGSRMHPIKNVRPGEAEAQQRQSDSDSRLIPTIATDLSNTQHFHPPSSARTRGTRPQAESRVRGALVPAVDTHVPDTRTTSLINLLLIFSSCMQ